MSLRKSFKTNPEAEAAGVWVDVGYSEQFKGPISFKLARMSSANKQYATALERAQRPHETSMRSGTMSTELGNRIFREVFAANIIKDWRNVSKADLTGNDKDEAEQLMFSAENALKLCEELPDMYNLLFAKANDVAEFTEARQAEASGN